MRRWILYAWLPWLIVTGAAQELATSESGDELGTPPLAPVRPKDWLSASAGQTSFSTFLRITNRETSRQFYNLVFNASENVPMDWSGHYNGAGDAGTNATDYLEAVVRRVNYFRAMAGVPAWITFGAEYNRKAQLAALMMGGNDRIDHYPTTSWRFYTAEGAEAARSSNLSLGHAGPQAVVGQMRDNGVNNALAGHRRWILYPQTRVMGSGNVPTVGTNRAANVLWVFDSHLWDARPATRESFVAWPPPGFVPHQVVYARWSFAYPNASFTDTTVSMTSNGVPVSVALEPLGNGYGENALVWIPAGWNPTALAHFPKPETDTVYNVALSNVRIGGASQNFSYTVRVFDPAVAGNDHMASMISGPSSVTVNTANRYTFNEVNGASGYEFRQTQLENMAFFDGAELPLTNWTIDAATNLYAVRDSSVKFAGAYSFHLTHTQAVTQTLTLNRRFLATSNGAVQFRSRLATATPYQVARVQISLDDGNSWSDVYTQPGSGGSGEATFSARNVSLAPFAGRTVRLRCQYAFSSGSYFRQASPGVGWYLDNFTVTNAPEVLSPTISRANPDRTFTFSPAEAGLHLLEVRPLLFGDYASEWSPGLAVNATGSVAAQVQIRGITRSSNNVWHIDFEVLSGTASEFELWSAMTLSGALTRESGATIQAVIPGTRYRATVNSSAASKFFHIKPQ